MGLSKTPKPPPAPTLPTAPKATAVPVPKATDIPIPKATAVPAVKPITPIAITPAAEVAKTAQKYNANAQAGSAIDQTNQYGNLKYEIYTDANGVQRMRSNVSLNPQQQQLFDTQQGTAQAAGNQAQSIIKGLNVDSNPNFNEGADSTVNQNLARYQEYLKPGFTAATENLDNQLRNQGLVPGMPAYDRAVSQLRQDQGNQVSGFLAQMQPEAFNQAVTAYKTPIETQLNAGTTLASMGTPGSVQSGLVNGPTQAGVDYASISGNTQDRAIAQNQMGFNNANTIYQNQYGATQDQFKNQYGATQEQYKNQYGATQDQYVNEFNRANQGYNQAMQQYQQKLASNNSMMNGIFGIGGTIAGAALGGPIGASIGSSLGSAMGGGQQQGYGNSWTPMVTRNSY